MIKPEWGANVRALARDAFWYAYGRQDAGGIRIDPWDFSQRYGDLAHALDTGATSHRPSIQDTYRQMEQEVA